MAVVGGSLAETAVCFVSVSPCPRQWLLALLLVVGLGGCGSIHLIPPEAPVVTNSIAAPDALAFGGTERTDWDAIRTTVTKAPVADREARIPWHNPATGNSGTITNLTALDRRGQSCRGFASTVSAGDGVRLFRAELCKSVMDTWEFAKVESAEASEALN